MGGLRRRVLGGRVGCFARDVLLASIRTWFPPPPTPTPSLYARSPTLSHRHRFKACSAASLVEVGWRMVEGKTTFMSEIPFEQVHNLSYHGSRDRPHGPPPLHRPSLVVEQAIGWLFGSLAGCVGGCMVSGKSWLLPKMYSSGSRDSLLVRAPDS